MWVGIAFIAGIVFGSVLTLAVFRVKHIGTLRIDSSDPYEGPYMFLELRKDVGNIGRKKYVVLKVNTKSYISQK
jgi:hypothetical protein